ncbi:MAG: ABC transporter ATP-binding protein [Ignavibacteria bacterium]|nr:ABC transporter ATP-binding protein [Ignavibacteria bacterium]
MKNLLSLLPYLKRHRRTLFVGVGAIFLSVVFSMLAPILIRKAIDGLQAHAAPSSIFRYAALVLLVSAVSGVFLFLQRRTIIVASRRIEYDLRNDFIAHIETLSLRYFQNTPTGDIMAHSTNDIAAIRMFVGPAIMYSVETLFTFVIILTALLSIHPMLTLYALLPLPLISFAVNRLGTVIHRRFEDIQNQYSALTTRAQESISGIRVVKSYLREDYEIGRFQTLSEEYLARNMRMARVQAFFMPLLSMLIGLSVIIVVWYGGLQVMDRKLTLGGLTQFMMYISMMIWPMIAVGWVVGLVQRASASMKRLNRILELEPEIADSPVTDGAITRLSGEIVFDHVTFRYNEGSDAILDDVSLTIPAGSTLAIIGYTGSGKSSLVQLIPRLYDVTGGALRIDGHDVRAIPLAVLRRSIACVTQETFLFSDSIRANIAYSVDAATEDDIVRAANTAQIAKDIADFPAHYDTVLGERGITLSGGQKQRVSLARAMLRRPAILILDDALSAVDTHTEEEILKNLKDVMRERTSIIISHRISTVKHADAIIVLHEGRIAEQGTHDQLVALGGIYADLHAKQLLAEELAEME